jgi:uncharacterized membrane protein YidH (DUF202 family)
MSQPERAPVRGLQRERTILAWERTGAGFLVVSLLFVRAAGGMSWLWQLPGVAGVLLGCYLMLSGLRRYPAASSDLVPGGFSWSGLLRVVGVATVLFSVTAAVMIVLR